MVCWDLVALCVEGPEGLLDARNTHTTRSSLVGSWRSPLNRDPQLARSVVTCGNCSKLLHKEYP